MLCTFHEPTQAIAPSVHRPGATQATAISVHFPRATHATAISVSTAFQNATGRGRPCAVPTSPWGRGSKEVQGCRLPAFKTRQNYPNPPPAAPRRHSGRGRPFLQLSQVPEAVAASFYGRWRLPLASLRNSPNSRNPPLQLPGATQAAADLSCSSNKFLEAVAVSFYGGPRLPFASHSKLFPNHSSTASSHGAPRTPQAAADLSCSSNKSLRPWQWVLLRRFKAAVCQPSKLPKPSPAAPRRHSGRGRPFLQL